MKELKMVNKIIAKNNEIILFQMKIRFKMNILSLTTFKLTQIGTANNIFTMKSS